MSLITLTFRKPAVFAALLAALTLIGAPLPRAAAQSSTSGAIGGTISDSSGALLPATTVTVTSTDKGITRTVKANASGEYHVSDLEPGVYSASFTADGFETYIESAITVTVGSLSNVSPKLKAGSVSDKVEVTDETPLMHTQDNAVSTTIDQSTIQNLPINGRRWSDFARLTPGVVSNSQGFGLLSFRGISFLLNNNTVDGADDNQAYYSEARGRTRTAYTISPAAVQEFQVNTSNYSAQYGRSAGGVINTVTKSGSNTMHGELFYFDRDVNLGGAASPYSLVTVPNAAGVYTSVPVKQTDWRKEWGFGIGGPILRNKLFWFYTYDQERRNFPFDSRPTDTNDTLAPSNPTLPASETCSTTAFTATAVSQSVYTEGDYSSCEIAALFGTSFQAGSAYYTQGLGIVNSFTGVVPRKQDQVLNLPKLDYQINDRNRLSLMYNRFRYSSPNGLYSQTSYSEGPSGLGNDNVKEDFGIVRLASVLSSSMVNDALVQYGRDFEFDYQDKPVPNELPEANNYAGGVNLGPNAYGAAASTQIGYYTSSVYAGSNPDLTRYADPDERRLQLLDGLTWSKGKHTAKFGLEFNKVSDYDNNLYNGNGSYSYDWAYTYIADYLNLTTGLGGPVAQTYPTGCAAAKCYYQQYYSYGQEFGNPAGLITTREYAGYATDDWRITPNLTLTLGVRYEYEYVPLNPFVNNGNPGLDGLYPGSTALNGTALTTGTTVANTNNRPDDRNNIAPRFGFSWNVYGDGKTILRGGYGVYYGRIINSNILQTDIDSGAPSGNLSFSSLHPTSSSAQGCGPQWPNVLPNTSASITSLYTCLKAQGGNTATVAYFDNHFQNPQIHEADIALEQNLGRNTTLAVTYMLSLGRELPTAIDTNLNNATGTALAPFAISSSAVTTSFGISPNSEVATALNKYPQLFPNSGYVVYPHGGHAPPTLPAGFQGKFFIGTGGHPDPAYYQILKVESEVNSSYNALAFQVDHRFDHGFQLLTNVTWSHALDENPYESTVVPGETFFDPTNARSSYGNSNTDVRIRYVGAIVYQPQTHFRGLKQQVLGGWRIAPLVQAQTGLPYSATISSNSFYNVYVPGAGSQALNGTGVNGSGSSGANVVPWQHRNSYNYPKTAVFDMRIGKNFYLPRISRLAESRLEIFAEVFNVANHQNITGVNTEAYTLTDATVNGNANTPTLTPYPLFGQYTNSNNNFTYTPRQLQIAARLHF